jgi:hypothetical protein
MGEEPAVPEHLDEDGVDLGSEHAGHRTRSSDDPGDPEGRPGRRRHLVLSSTMTKSRHASSKGPLCAEDRSTLREHESRNRGTPTASERRRFVCGDVEPTNHTGMEVRAWQE